MIRVAINGYGRIGRIAHRVLLERNDPSIELVAINAGHSTDLMGWKYLLEYDTIYGKLKTPVIAMATTDPTHPEVLGTFTINAKQIAIYSQKDPTLLPWKDLQVDVVIEATGKLTSEQDLQKHITAGAKVALLSAPAKDTQVHTYVCSANDSSYQHESVLSNASCTTNCITPIAKIMDDHFGIEKAMMSTIHAYTSDQKLQDGGHKDYRRARAAGQNIVPTSTGATKATGMVLPSLKDNFTGVSFRVPVPVGSLSDITFLLKKNTTVEEVNTVFTNEAQTETYNRIIKVTTDPLVSSDIIGEPYSAIVDMSLTQVVGGNMVKVIAWYDNEYGYANRLIDEVLMIGKK